MNYINLAVRLTFLLLILGAFNCGGTDNTSSENLQAETTSETVEETTSQQTNSQSNIKISGTVSATGNGETYSGNAFDADNGHAGALTWQTLDGKTRVVGNAFPTTPHKIQVTFSLINLPEGSTTIAGSYTVSKENAETSQGNIGAKVFAENGEIIMIALEEGTINVQEIDTNGTVKLTAEGKGFFGVTAGENSPKANSLEELAEMEKNGALARYIPKNDVPVSFSVNVQLPKDVVMVQKY